MLKKGQLQKQLETIGTVLFGMAIVLSCVHPAFAQRTKTAIVKPEPVTSTTPIPLPVTGKALTPVPTPPLLSVMRWIDRVLRGNEITQSCAYSGITLCGGGELVATNVGDLREGKLWII